MTKELFSADSGLNRRALTDVDPPADLWCRIEAAHRARVARRRKRRLTGATFVVAVCASVVGYVQLHGPAAGGAESVDWQARAETLELQLYAMQRDNQFGQTGSHGLESELGEIDQSLQTAYESGAATDVLVPLWKRRSELLDTLIVARKQNLILTRI